MTELTKLPDGTDAIRFYGGENMPVEIERGGLVYPKNGTYVADEIADPTSAIALAIHAIIDPMFASTAMVTELTASTIYAASIAATLAIPIWIAPFGCKITGAAAYINATPPITADDTNYWTVDLRRIRAGTAAVIASKTTQVTGGETIAIRTAWTFDAVAFSATNQVLQAGDAVDFAFTKTAAATSLSSPSMYMIRYEPV